MERDYVGLSEATSAFNNDPKDDEEELELGLSLGAGKVTAGKNKTANYGCRILTAKDLPTARGRGSRESPRSSSSSSSVPSSATLRVADRGEPDGAGSSNPPSQAVVGWPPIRAFRINNLINPTKDNDAEAISNKKNNGSLCNNDNELINAARIQEKKIGSWGITRFVKVKMDGDPIGRKVDLNAHQSYEALALALAIMFHKPTIGLSSSPHGNKVSKLDGSSEFALTYEDKDGDWMLVGDVPWRMFLDMVKRLRIMRASDANGLAPSGFQSSTGGIRRSKPA